MAEINSPAGPGRHNGGVRQRKKLSTKVDLTPMVDLGFLLITFFVFTASMSRPKSMKLFLPAGELQTKPTGQSTVLTIIPILNDKVFYYQGELQQAIASGAYGVTNFSVGNGIGDIIRKKQVSLASNARFTKNDLMLIIKPAMDARYQNVVAALDEVLINDVKHFAFIDLDLAEKQTLDRLGIK